VSTPSFLGFALSEIVPTTDADSDETGVGGRFTAAMGGKEAAYYGEVEEGGAWASKRFGIV